MNLQGGSNEESWECLRCSMSIFTAYMSSRVNEQTTLYGCFYERVLRQIEHAVFFVDHVVVVLYRRENRLDY